MKTGHLDTTPWIDYASGTVDGCFPNPVTPATIIDLALFEASEHGATHVSLSLGNKYNSGHLGKDMQYKGATIGSLTEGDFCTTTGAMNESHLGENQIIGLNATRRYLPESIFKESAKTVSELIVKLAAKQVTGTLSIYFYTYPNGSRCHSNVIKHFNICL